MAGPTRDETKVQVPDDTKGCDVCGKLLASSIRGRPRVYCSRACRERAYRLRVQAGVAGANAQSSPGAPSGAPVRGLTLDRIVAAALAVGDRQGVDAISMRSTADELGAGVMSLYRHVGAKDELVDLVVDRVFGERPLPEQGAGGWRDMLELSARQEWAVYEARPWVAPLVAATTRPPIAVNLMRYTDWRMRALDGHSLDPAMMLTVAVTVSTFVQGAALTLAQERRAESDGAGSQEEWLDARQVALKEAFGSGRLPMVSRFGASDAQAARPGAVFELGLACLLDGIGLLVGDSTS